MHEMLFLKSSIKCTFILIPALFFADDNLSSISMTTYAQTKGAKLADGWHAPQSHGIGVTVDTLYWHPKVDGTAFTYSSATSPVVIPLEGTIYEVPFDWSWGFRAGVFIDTSYDSWNVEAEYTNFREVSSKKLNAGTNSTLVPLKGYTSLASDTLPVVSCGTAQSNFDLDYQTALLDITKTFFITPSLSVSIFGGLEGAWIDLKQNSTYSGGSGVAGATLGLGNNNNKVKDKTSLTGIGPSIGVATHLNCGHGISFFVDTSAALLQCNYKTYHKEIFSGASERTIDINTSIRRVTPTAGIILGMAYDTYFNANANYLSIKFGYETVYWWQVYRPIIVSSVTNTVPTLSGNLAFYGLTLQLALEF